MARTQVQSELIATNAISGTIIADNAITATHIATNSISGTLVQDSGIVTTMIAANNITSTKIVTDAVLTRHIADDQVTAAKLANSINTDIATGPAALPKAGGTMTGALIIQSSSSGATADGGANDLVVENSGNSGISILSGASSSGSIYFGDSGSAFDGYINYAQNNQRLGFATAGTARMYIGSTGKTSWAAGGVGAVATQSRDFTFYTEGSTNGVAIHSNDERLIFMGAAASSGTGVDTGYLQLENGGSTTVALNSNGDSYFTGGDVGIGTNDPDARLEIVSTDPRIRLRDETSGGGADNGGQIEFVGYHASSSDGKREFARIKGLKENSTGGDTDGYLSFLVNQGGTLTENMRLESNGLVGIATDTPGAILDVRSPGTTFWNLRANAVDSDYGIQARGQGSYAYACLDSASNTYRGRWQYNGTLYTQDGSVHDIDSDERLKEDITDCPSQWSLIKDLPLQRFKWKDRRNGDIFSYGWIAQPTKAKYPEFVEPIPQPKEDIDEGKEDPEYLTVRSGDIQRRSIAALQEAMTRIEALEAEVAALKG